MTVVVALMRPNGASAGDLQTRFARDERVPAVPGGGEVLRATTDRFDVRAGASWFEVSARAGASVRLETISVKRSDRVDAPASGWRVDGARLVTSRGGVVERLSVVPEGVEQSWSFDRRPSGPGDLVVKVAIGMHRVTSDPRGLLVATATGSPIRVGLATWVDARGRRFPAAAHVDADGTAIDFTVPAGLVDSSSYPAVLDPVVGPEIPVSEPTIGADYWATFPAVGVAASTYLVAWISERPEPSAPLVQAVRVDAASGALLDSLPIPVLPEGDEAVSQLEVTSDGTDFLVTWCDPNVRAARVRGTDGAVLDATPWSLTAVLPPYAVTFGAGNYFFAGMDASGELVGARVSPSGALVDTTPIVITLTFSSPDATPSGVVFDDAHFVVAWSDSRNNANSGTDIYAARIDATTGALLDGPPGTGGIAICTQPLPQFSPRLAFDGTNVLVAWLDQRAFVFAARVQPSTGTLLDGPAATSGVQVGQTLTTFTPRAAYAAGNYVLTFQTVTVEGGRFPLYVGGPLAAVRVRASDLTVLDTSTGPNPIFGSDGPGDYGFPSNPSAPIACAGSACLVAWQGVLPSPGPSVLGTLMDPSTGASVGGNAPVAAVLSTAYVDQTLPAAAWGTTTALVVWLEGENLYGSRLDGNTGAPIDAAPISLTTTAILNLAPMIAFDGANYLVAWIDQRGVYAERVRETDGALLDGPSGSGGVLVGALEGNLGAPLAGLAYAGGNYLVVGSDFVTLVSASDASLTPSETFYPFGPGMAMAGGAQSFLLAELDTLGAGSYGLYYLQVQSAGGEDGGGVGALQEVTMGIEASTLAASPSIAFDGANFLVAYPSVTTDPQTGVTTSQVDAIRVRESDGAVLDPVPIVVASTLDTVSDYHDFLDVAYDGTNFVFAWVDTRGGVYGARVGRDGTLLDGPPAANGSLLSPSPVLPQVRSGPLPSPVLDVVLSAGANGMGLETQARYLGDLGLDATRVVDRFVNWEDAGALEAGSDAGASFDGGGIRDASATDASPTDGGATDASGTDARGANAGTSALEAGSTNATNGSPGRGGSCSVGPARGAANGSLFGVLVAAWAIRRRRRRASRKALPSPATP